MAAVIDLRTAHTVPQHLVEPTRPARPQLTVLEGGRSPRVLHQQRVYRRRRLLVAVAAVVVALGAVWAVGALSGPSAPQRVELHTVQPGDTLWGIASSVDPGADTREVVDRIVELNSGSHGVAVDGSVLRVGSTLRIPAAS